MTTDRLRTAQGEFVLARFPKEKGPLQAWCAADEHLLQAFEQQSAPQWHEGQRLLIVNDTFGALATALHRYQPDSWSDSYLAHKAVTSNLQRNDLPPDSVQCLPSVQRLQGAYNAALIVLPKSMSLLAWQLDQISRHLSATGTVSLGYMVKHFQPRARAQLAQHFGTVTGSQTFKKSRLLYANAPIQPPPGTPDLQTHYPLEGTPFSLSNDVNLFSRQHLDIGTRELLKLIPSNPGLGHIVDLGCGNGALGIMAAYRNPQAHVSFIDESYLAVRCADNNMRNTGLQNAYTCEAGHGLSESQVSADLILLNPPFHQQTSLVSHLSHNLFQQARQHLSPSGELWVVGNRHLNYHVSLRKIFPSVKQVSASAKFVVFRASLC